MVVIWWCYGGDMVVFVPHDPKVDGRMLQEVNIGTNPIGQWSPNNIGRNIRN